jgi:hypothetical protein
MVFQKSCKRLQSKSFDIYRRTGWLFLVEECGKQRTGLTCMLHQVSYRGANEDPPGYVCLIFD